MPIVDFTMPEAETIMRGLGIILREREVDALIREWLSMRPEDLRTLETAKEKVRGAMRG